MEWILAASSLAGLWGLCRGQRWGWLVATASSLGYTRFCLQQGLNGQALLQGVYASLQLAGWWGSRSDGSFHRRARAYLWMLLALPLGAGLQRAMGAADAWLTALALAAQIMTSLRIHQVWRLWVAIDLATALLYASCHCWPTAGLYLILAAVAEQGHRQAPAHPKPGE